VIERKSYTPGGTTNDRRGEPAMMRLALLVIFYLLALVAAAHAECAWVLWSQVKGYDTSAGSHWSISDELPSKKGGVSSRVPAFS
jgi:hypothetical protein